MLSIAENKHILSKTELHDGNSSVIIEGAGVSTPPPSPPRPSSRLQNSNISTTNVMTDAKMDTSSSINNSNKNSNITNDSVLANNHPIEEPDVLKAFINANFGNKESHIAHMFPPAAPMFKPTNISSFRSGTTTAVSASSLPDEALTASSGAVEKW